MVLNLLIWLKEMPTQKKWKANQIYDPIVLPDSYNGSSVPVEKHQLTKKSKTTHHTYHIELINLNTILSYLIPESAGSIYCKMTKIPLLCSQVIIKCTFN